MYTLPLSIFLFGQRYWISPGTRHVVSCEHGSGKCSLNQSVSDRGKRWGPEKKHFRRGTPHRRPARRSRALWQRRLTRPVVVPSPRQDRTISPEESRHAQTAQWSLLTERSLVSSGKCAPSEEGRFPFCPHARQRDSRLTSLAPLLRPRRAIRNRGPQDVRGPLAQERERSRESPQLHRAPLLGAQLPRRKGARRLAGTCAL